MATTLPKRVRHFSTVTTVDVEIDPDDLHDGGWHHEDECPATTAPPVAPCPAPPVAPCPAPPVTLMDAVLSLHRQAHPSQLPDPVTCHEEPCRSLTLDQLRGGAR